MKVAVIRSWYLPVSETFIYSELVNVKKHDVIVCAKKLMHLDDFPFQPIFRFQTLDELEKILQTERVDLIHARFGLTGAEVLPVKKHLGIPMITSFHGFDLPSNQKSLQKYKGKLNDLFQTCERFTATSQDMKEILVRHGCPEQKVQVHHSGIDLHRFRYHTRKPPIKSDVRILSVGRLIAKKGMNDAIEAFARVAKKYPAVQLRIVGDGPLRKKLKRQVNALKLTEKVRFLGELSQERVQKELEQAHLFVLASATDEHGNQEGIPNALKEAMACGLPVVSTNHAGIPELVQNGQSGILVREHRPKELAKALLNLLNSPEMWRDMGAKGRKIVAKQFDLKHQVQELETIYRDVYGNNT